VRLHDPLLSKIDDWRTAQHGAPTRAEALRRLADWGLGAGGTKMPRIVTSGDALNTGAPGASAAKATRAKKTGSRGLRK
jgi:hypothetical protein